MKVVLLLRGSLNAAAYETETMNKSAFVFDFFMLCCVVLRCVLLCCSLKVVLRFIKTRFGLSFFVTSHFEFLNFVFNVPIDVLSIRETGHRTASNKYFLLLDREI